MAMVLRHRAEEYGLRPDAEGFVPLDDFLEAVHRQRGWEWVCAEHIEEVIANQQKRRYEIVDGDLRAIYGHSIETAITYQQVVPPDLLLHGTARRFLEAIRRDGLRPMSRQYVHLTDDPFLAELTGKRRDAKPMIVRIDAAQAHRNGIVFYQADNGIFLTKGVPPAYLVLE